jgi:two-component system CheB/CheR fusion protein
LERYYAQADGRRVILNGPAVNLPPDVATPLAFVLHELATNAIKFGALSAPDGTLRLDWGFRVNGGDREFRYSWRESGGPKVQPPAKEGFGSWLIQNGLPDAHIELTFPETGAVCTVTLPAEHLGDE